MEIKKLTQKDLDNLIDSTETEFIYRGTLTICILTLHSGFTVIGESACMNSADYDKKIGEKLALENATNKLWELLGFHLMQKQYEHKETNNENN